MSEHSDDRERGAAAGFVANLQALGRVVPNLSRSEAVDSLRVVAIDSEAISAWLERQ